LAGVFLETRKISRKGQNAGKSVLSSSTGEGASYSSESKNDRRKQPKPKWFERGDYRSKDHNLEKTVLGSIAGEDVFCSSETKHDRRTAPRRKSFVSARRLQEQKPELRKTVLGFRVPVKMFLYLRE
jgi:hypothetical protein